MNRPIAFLALAVLAAGISHGADAIKAARGARRFTDIAALPVTDPGAQIHYEGSIDRGGYNGDYFWGTYQDKHGDWVLMETDKPGCLYNFVQHRSLSPVWVEREGAPVFKFYFEGEDEPRFTISRPEFGEKAPFSFYLTYGYVNKANNRGPNISFFSRLKGWSLMRETVVDCCYFDHFMRFELEHGDANEEDDAALYGGQVFAYLMER